MACPAQHADVAQIGELLRTAGLPPDGLCDAWLVLLADQEVTAGRLVGAAALERHTGHSDRAADRPGAAEGASAYLLRSVVVSPTERGRGLGRRLVTRALDIADHCEAGRADVSLLTMSRAAAQFFTTMGFRRIPREDLPEALSASAQLRGACPDSADAWRRV